MKLFWFTLCAMFILSSCIKDDLVFDEVDPELRIISAVDTIAIDSSYEFRAIYLNNVGEEAPADIRWQSTAPEIISIDARGLATALQPGSATISASFDDATNVLQDEVLVHTGELTTSIVEERSGTIRTTSFYTLEGAFTLQQNENLLEISIDESYRASSSLPGLYLYLSNNPNSIANALEVAAVEVFSGAHTYSIENVDIDTYSYLLYYCKPFNVKVGDGQIQ